MGIAAYQSAPQLQRNYSVHDHHVNDRHDGSTTHYESRRISSLQVPCPVLSAENLEKLDEWIRTVLWENRLPKGPHNGQDLQVLRCKGLFTVASGERYVLQGVQNLYEISRMDAKDATGVPESGKLVLIGKGLDESVRWSLLEVFEWYFSSLTSFTNAHCLSYVNHILLVILRSGLMPDSAICATDGCSKVLVKFISIWTLSQSMASCNTSAFLQLVVILLDDELLIYSWSICDTAIRNPDPTCSQVRVSIRALRLETSESIQFLPLLQRWVRFYAYSTPAVFLIQAAWRRV